MSEQGGSPAELLDLPDTNPNTIHSELAAKVIMDLELAEMLLRDNEGEDWTHDVQTSQYQRPKDRWSCKSPIPEIVDLGNNTSATLVKSWVFSTTSTENGTKVYQLGELVRNEDDPDTSLRIINRFAVFVNNGRIVKGTHSLQIHSYVKKPRHEEDLIHPTNQCMIERIKKDTTTFGNYAGQELRYALAEALLFV